ncbi:MAG: hypothetical protein IPK82_30565 [Polyangiaceae bacterium]|nr:hypothetical protein [Polyangiaceae bacterium]
MSANLTVLWVHGRWTGGEGWKAVGNYDDFRYWGASNVEAGANKKAVNWGGEDRISLSNVYMRRALDCFCTGKNACVLAGHSAGDVQIGYALSLYGQSDRPVTNGVPDASGRCESTGETQQGWNVQWVSVAGGAAGGSELADVGEWAVSDTVTGDLRTDTARALYDHNATQGVWFYRFAAANGAVYSSILPGQDDEVVSYHSSGGLADVGAFCNPGDWYCDDELPMDGAASPKLGTTKWDHHTLYFRDDGEDYNHHTKKNWGGIVGPMRNDVVAYASGN